jgi:hypothetical protein
MREMENTELNSQTRRYSWLLLDQETILTRLLVWVSEIFGEAVFLGLLLATISAVAMRSPRLLIAVPGLAYGVLFVFTTTGYILTSGLGRVLWNGRAIWSYPIIAVVLFLIHFEILTHGTDENNFVPHRVVIRIVGVAITFVCTLMGSKILKELGRLKTTRFSV